MYREDAPTCDLFHRVTPKNNYRSPQFASVLRSHMGHSQFEVPNGLVAGSVLHRHGVRHSHPSAYRVALAKNAGLIAPLHRAHWWR